MEQLFACLMILDITGLSKEKAEMIINMTNEALICAAFCSQAQANIPTLTKMEEKKKTACLHEISNTAKIKK